MAAGSGSRRRTVTPDAVTTSAAHAGALAGGANGRAISVNVTGRTGTARRRARTSHHWSVESGSPISAQNARCVRPLARYRASVSSGDSDRRGRGTGTDARAVMGADMTASVLGGLGPRQMHLSYRLR